MVVKQNMNLLPEKNIKENYFGYEIDDPQQLKNTILSTYFSL